MTTELVILNIRRKIENLESTMKLVVHPSEAVLLHGPARFSIESGKGHVFYKESKAKEVIEVPSGVTYPFVSTTRTILLSNNDDVLIRIVKKSEIYPESWSRALKEIPDTIKDSSSNSAIIVAVGGISSGKSGFISSLAHLLLRMDCNVYMLDLDVGQNKLLIPGCLVLSRLDSSDKNPFPKGKILKAIFLGSNSPRGLLTTIIGACWKFKREWDHIVKQPNNESKKNVLLIDTTGYVSGLEASALKRTKLEIFNPNHVVLFPESMNSNSNDDLITVIESLQLEPHLLTIPPSIKAQNLQERRQTREAKYAQFFKKMTPMEFSMQELSFFSYSMKIEQVPDITNRLIGFLDENGWLIGLGYLKSINIKKGTLNVLARSLHDKIDLKKDANSILFSYIRLNEDGTEYQPSTMDTSIKSEMRERNKVSK